MCFFFAEGVCHCKKDFNLPEHPEIKGVPNLQVIKAMQSLKSKGHVTEQFAWRHFYWYLTESGLEYLRTFLHIPEDVVPTTHKQKARAPGTRPPMREGGERRFDGPRRFEGGEGRDSYRREGGPGGFGGEKKVGAGSDFKPEFRGGRGRGAPRE